MRTYVRLGLLLTAVVLSFVTVSQLSGGVEGAVQCPTDAPKTEDAQVTLDPSWGPAGTSFNVAVDGVRPSDTAVEIYWDSTTAESQLDWGTKDVGPTGYNADVDAPGAATVGDHSIIVCVGAGASWSYQDATFEVTAPTPHFFDDFNDGNADGWTVVQGDWEVIDGWYHTDAPIMGFWSTVADSVSCGDCTVEVTTRFGDAAVGFRHGIVFRRSTSNDFYVFAPSHEYDRVEILRYSEIDSRTYGTRICRNSYPVERNVNYRLRVEAVGNSFTAYINGEEVLGPASGFPCSDSTHTSGQIGLSATRADAFFDDVTVWLPGTDDDSDGDSLGQGPGAGFFRDSVELFVGTDPDDDCADTSDPNDETGVGESPWPPDFNDNGSIEIGDLVGLKNHWVPLDNPYGVRYDLNANGECDIGDLVVMKQYWTGGGYDTCTVG